MLKKYFTDVISVENYHVPMLGHKYQFDILPKTQESVLHSYLTGSVKTLTTPPFLIYPFGINESQKKAVESAFSSQVSIIQGPPGTGKTQTILNIIANILINKQSVAIISNNNEAVDNIIEKLEKSSLDKIVAPLGKKSNVDQFFEKVSNSNDDLHQLDFDEKNNVKQSIQIASDIIHGYVQEVDDLLIKNNQLASLKIDLLNLKTEFQHHESWLLSHKVSCDIEYSAKNFSLNKLQSFIHQLNQMRNDHISFMERVGLFFKYFVFKTNLFNTLSDRKLFIYQLEHYLYKKRISEIEIAIDNLTKFLDKKNINDLIQKLSDASMSYLKNYLKTHITKEINFTRENYKYNLQKFLDRFPIVTSSAYALVSSLGNKKLVDYLIIDEASQLSLIPGIINLGIAKNIVIVGDQQQLAPVMNLKNENFEPTKDSLLKLPRKEAIEILNSKCDSKYQYREDNSLLVSFNKVFNGKAPNTILREHYRCHPLIIQFCNQQFYNNELVIMKKFTHDNPLKLIFTPEGNHERENTNIRELETYIHYASKNNNIGFITPYGAQVSKAKELLSKNIVSNTVHAFQGREMHEIVFSTVIDKKSAAHKYKVNFVDNYRLINVAVSRAKDYFTLITGKSVFPEYSNIAALQRYIKYYSPKENIIESKVVSSFDLLYAEYDAQLEKINKDLSIEDSEYKSEQIIAHIIRKILQDKLYKDLTFHKQIPLIRLVTGDIYEQAENNQQKNRWRQFLRLSSCDFVFFYKVGQQPALVVEVDGYAFHNNDKQIERDTVKDCILQAMNIPILRLKTHESGEEEKIKHALNTVLGFL